MRNIRIKFSGFMLVITVSSHIDITVTAYHEHQRERSGSIYSDTSEDPMKHSPFNLSKRKNLSPAFALLSDSDYSNRDSAILSTSTQYKKRKKPALMLDDLEVRGPHIVHSNLSKEKKDFNDMIQINLNQVFKVLASGDNQRNKHSGNAWIFDAQRAILATSHHIVPPYFNSYKLQAQDGTVYQGQQVKVLGVSPSIEYGDYGFLQIPELQGQFKQMEFVQEHTVKLLDTVGVIRNHDGELSVEEGMVNNLYNFDMIKLIESFQICLLCKEGTNGSPVFNTDGKINGLLYASDDIRSLVHPIWYIQRAYNIMITGPAPRPISMKSFHFVYHPISLHNICNYRNLDVNKIQKYVSTKDGQKQHLLMLSGDFSGQNTGDKLQAGDILLKVRNKKIGCNTIQITKILDETPSNTSIAVKVLRINKILNLNIVPDEVTQIYASSLQIGQMKIITATPSLFNTHYTNGTPLLVSTMFQNSLSELAEERIIGAITFLDDFPVTSFNTCLKALQQTYIHQHREYLTVTCTNTIGRVISTPHFDFTSLGHIEPYVSFFDYECLRWKKLLLTHYLEKFEEAAC